MLTDEVTIRVNGGNGGNGSVSFIRNSRTDKGGPDGGNGGNGGEVYFEALNDISLLEQFNYKKEIKAEDGVAGSKQKMHGRNGKDLIVKVPLGTQIFDIDSKTMLELNNIGERILLARGGQGGRGNNEFKSATIQAPHYRELGQPGEEKHLRIELKMIADIGIIGLPNAGKSSLLEALTDAHPKIANYPFTTLEPNLGVFNHLVIADIPGLIEGASGGKGLGGKFLRHIERTKLLVHCIDSTSLDIPADYKIIRNELRQFNPGLIEKKEIIVFTKTDLISKDQLDKKINLFKKINGEVLSVSVIDEKSLENFSNHILEEIQK